MTTRPWILLALAACSEPSIETCEIACEPSVGCPGGFECSHGRCAMAGTSCPVCSAAAAAAVPCVRALDAGGRHACAIDACDQLWCWGANDYGQRGFLSAGSGAGRPDSLVDPVSAFSAGGSHTCAVVFGALYCWGYNREWELGMLQGASVPTANGIADIATVAAAANHTCALTLGGNVECWGEGYDGELGNGTSVSPQLTPVLALTGASAVVAGASHTCAIVDGDVWCWGHNDFGQVDGNNAIHTHPSAVHITAVHDVVELALGEVHSCARERDGSVWCWGLNKYGSLGIPDGVGGDQSVLPSRVDLAFAADAITAGALHTCALTGGHVWCWGNDSDGAVDGAPTPAPISTPVQVLAAEGSVQIAGGDGFTCATMMQGVACWGRNDFGQLGGPTGPAPTQALVCDPVGGAASAHVD